ncbi:MAG: DEAD/DEAH box helicase [Candidatus Eisenbacteria bacterium]|nr:DEAD/DEAH box helicase [Candidatus Eisenbacteria bacterium]
MTTRSESNAPSGFRSLGLSPGLVAAVATLGYEEPTAIQSEAIPVLLSGRDMVGQAGTGTGKTAAFSLPMLHRLAEGSAGKRGTGEPRALVLVPTRELAMQVAEAVHKYARGTKLTVVPLYGGASMDQQIRSLKRGADVIVATPGRALDHLRRRTLVLSSVEVVVLDEADEMLDMGFAEDLEAILSATPATRQTALFAATMAPRIAAIAGRHLKNPSRVTIAQEKRPAGKMPRIRQAAYIVSREQKLSALGRVLEFENPKSCMVFCRTRIEVDELTENLTAHGYGAQALHGGMLQRQRDKVMQMFRQEKTDILVATDVAARGLDIDHVSHVINYDVPSAPEVYVHRIGRTGRIGREGVAITLANPREQRFLRSIESMTRQKIDMLSLPTMTDLRQRRLAAVRDAVRVQLLAGGLDEVRAIVESLVPEFDVLDIAAGAVKLVHDRSTMGGADGSAEMEIIPPTYVGVDTSRGTRAERSPGRSDRKDKKSPRRRETGGDVAVLFIGIGKKFGVRPGDIVGAITGEAGVDSDVIGSIRVTETHSLVEVPEGLASDIINALQSTKIRGKKVVIRRDRDTS